MLAEKKYPGDAEAFSKLEKLISEGKGPTVSGVTVRLLLVICFCYLFVRSICTT